MRAGALVVVLILAACGQAQRAPASRTAVCATISPNDGAAALAAYDRQIATLRALVGVPSLNTVAVAAAQSSRLARLQTQRAAGTVNTLVLRTRPYVRDAAVDPGTIETQIENAYARETSTVRAQAGRSQNDYQRALNAQASAQIATLARSLNQRISDAYSARFQYYAERESDAAVARARAVANRQLELRLKLDALAQTAPQRRTVAAELGEISRSLSSAAAAERTRDRAALAAYLRTLESQASAQYAQASADLQGRAAANLAIRQSVTQSQLAAPSRIPIPFDTALRGAMRTGAADLQSAQTQTVSQAAATSAQFTAAGNDIARRMAAIGAADASNTASLRSQLVAMQQARAALARAIAGAHGCAVR